MSPPNQDAQEGRPDSPTAEVVDVRRGMFGVSGTGDTSGYGRLVRQVVLPGSSPRPYGGYFDDIVDRLAEALRHERPGPTMISDRKLAWPADLQVGPDGLGNSPKHIAKIMGSSMEALIHHFKLVTEGIRVPAGQVYVAVESPRGELGVHMVSDGGTRPYRVHYRDPSFTNLQSVAAMCEGGMVADLIAAVASIDPVMGGVDR